MYGLDINFLKDRPEYQPDTKVSGAGRGGGGGGGGSILPFLVGLAAGIFPLAAVGGLLLFLQFGNTRLQEETADYSNQLSDLDTQLQQVGNINKEINQIEEETKKLASAFNQVKPWSAMLQDISNRYPAGVRLGTISQDRTRGARRGAKEKAKERFQIFGIAKECLFFKLICITN